MPSLPSQNQTSKFLGPVQFCIIALPCPLNFSAIVVLASDCFCCLLLLLLSLLLLLFCVFFYFKKILKLVIKVYQFISDF